MADRRDAISGFGSGAEVVDIDKVRRRRLMRCGGGSRGRIAVDLEEEVKKI